MKKTVLLFIMLLAVTITNAQLAAGTVFANGLFDYTVTTLTDPGAPNTVSVKGFTTGASIPAALSIPATVDQAGVTYTVTLIGANAFKSKATITSLLINGDTTIDSQSFASCTGLTTVNMPNVKKIGPAPTVGLSFWKCSSLTTINMPSVQSISTGAFNACTALSSITLPSSFTSFDETNYNMFKGCNNLNNVTLEYATFIPLTYNADPSTMAANPSIFADVVAHATLTIPNGTLANYQTADVWKNFATIIQSTSLTIEAVEKTSLKAYPNPVNDNLYFSSNDVDSVEIYTVLGAKVGAQKILNSVDTSSLSKGIYIIKCKNTTGAIIGTVKVVKN